MLQEISFLSSINTEHCFTALFTGLSYFLLNLLIRRKGMEKRKHNACAFFHHKAKNPSNRWLRNSMGI